MPTNPYADLPKQAFWKTGVESAYPVIADIYRKKWDIGVDEKIATAGSCFAQHIARHMKKNGYHVMNVEPTPPLLAPRLAADYGYDIYSARYGNIYTVQQLLQLAEEAFGEKDIAPPVFERAGRFFDAFRPGVEPDGLPSHADVLRHRALHLAAVRDLFTQMDVMVFTLGLTEHWAEKATNLVLPMAPGTIAGDFAPAVYEFRNASFQSVVSAFNAFQAVLSRHRGGRKLRFILTVSPVPLTATYSDQHVLAATTLSKSILRAAAGQISQNQHHVDYFPSFEIINNPAARGVNFLSNLRSVNPDAVPLVMQAFFAQHAPAAPAAAATTPAAAAADDDVYVKCEEAMLNAMAANG